MGQPRRNLQRSGRSRCALVCFLLSTALIVLSSAWAQQLNGAGASFPNPLYSRWFTQYSHMHPGVQINYQPVGSGAGIRQASEGIVDFGATDTPMTDAQMREARVKLTHIPTVLGAVVPAYNIPGLKGVVKFSGEVLASIYLGHITRWCDPRIAALNPGLRLPDHDILPVYRSDGSGTTFILTDFLARSSPAFLSEIGRNTSVRWKLGIGQKGNEGVAGMVHNTPYSIGYVELIYALQNHMTFGAVRNRAGAFVQASVPSVSAAADNVPPSMHDDFRISLVDAPGVNAYPIASLTWLLIPLHSQDPAKGRVLKDFLRWMLDHGEAEAASASYAPLSPSLAAQVRIAIRHLQ